MVGRKICYSRDVTVTLRDEPSQIARWVSFFSCKLASHMCPTSPKTLTEGMLARAPRFELDVALSDDAVRNSAGDDPVCPQSSLCLQTSRAKAISGFAGAYVHVLDERSRGS